MMRTAHAFAAFSGGLDRKWSIGAWLILASTSSSTAAVLNWTGRAFPDRSWFTPANWSQSAVAPPTASDSVEIAAGATVYLGRDTTVRSLVIPAGTTLDGAGARLTVTRALTLGGTVTNLSLSIAKGARMDWQTPGGGGQTTVDNEGTIEARGCRLTLGALNNRGLFTVSDGTCLDIASIHNAGILRKLGGQGLVQVSGERLENTGLIEVPSGTLLFDRCNLDSNGRLVLGNGQSQIQLYGGGIRLGPESVVVMGLGGSPTGLGRDELRSNGEVTLGGTLRIERLYATPLPMARRFDLVGFGTLQGGFSNIQGVDACDGISLEAGMTAASWGLTTTDKVQGQVPELTFKNTATGWELCWPPGFDTFRLQTSSNLREWSEVPTVATRLPLTSVASPESRFYRLWKP